MRTSSVVSFEIRMAALGALLLAAACGAARKAPESDAAAAAEPPLAGLSGQPMLVFPLQYVSGQTSASAGSNGEGKGYLARFDSTLERLLRERGIGSNWSFPAQLARSAQRNPGYVQNPSQLSAQRLKFPGRVPEGQLPDPLASQLRSWVAVQNSSLALLPVEVRLEGNGSAGTGRVRLVLIDGRRSTVRWAAEVRTDSTAAGYGDVVATLAMRVANLVLPP